MIALIQRVSRACVTVGGAPVGTIDRGILALVGIAAADTSETGARLVDKVLNYRIFPDNVGKMNLNLRQIGGGLLLVPQFTLLADTAKGTRPGFSSRAAPPERAAALFADLIRQAEAAYPKVASGRFGADMQVELVNDGPVTFWLEVV
jgi:D-tyrosyl-tRNA(Tyr) deacylase